MVIWRRRERADPRSEAGGRDRSDLDRTLADGASADVFMIYSCKALPERNVTYEVGKYAPGYVTIGDNGGGSALMLRGGPGPSPVYLVGHGVMSPKFMEEIAPSFSTWIATGCPLEEQ